MLSFKRNGAPFLWNGCADFAEYAALEDVNAKSLLKQVKLAKKLIGEKHVDFFEKEEGHLYEKIGEGIYQRKRIASVNSVNTIT